MNATKIPFYETTTPNIAIETNENWCDVTSKSKYVLFFNMIVFFGNNFDSNDLNLFFIVEFGPH